MNKGERYVQFIEKLKVPAGKYGNQTFTLQPWQREFVRNLFGTLRDDGLRQYRNALLFLPKKNGKTTLVAAIAVAHLFLDNEQGGQIYSAANSREQAALAFNAAAAMIRADPYLRKNCKILDSQKRITRPATNTFYKALSAESGDKNGTAPSLILCDEIAEWTDRELYDKLVSGTITRREPLTISLTTAGVARESIGYEIYQHAKRVKENPEYDSTFLPVIYEAPPEGEWNDLATWKAANPNWGITIEPDYAEKCIADAENMPTRLSQLERYHLNRWVDSEAAWIPSDKWDSCGLEKYDLADLAGRVCYAGIDLASTIDITAVVLLFPLEDGRYAVVPRFYVPQDSASRRERRDRVPYLTWIRQGYMTATPGEVCDYEFIRRDLNDLAKVYDIRSVAIDRWNAQSLSTQLDGDGLKVVPFGQGFASFSAPSKELEKLIIGGKLLHNANPVLAWMARNVVAEQDAAGNVKPARNKSTEKIDGIVALLMALGLSILEGPTAGSSVYESQELFVL